MTEAEFLDLYKQTLVHIEETVEAAINDADAELDYESGNDMLTLTFRNGSVAIISRQSAIRQLWLAARRDGSAHRLVAAAPSRAAALRLGDVAMRGAALCYGMRPLTIGDREVPETVSATLDIGVDRIHLDQGEAQRLETALRGRDGEPPPSWAVLSVGQDGKARLKGVIVGDRRVDLSWF